MNKGIKDLGYEDYLSLLEISGTESTEVIEDKVQQKLAEHHPDISSNENANEIYKHITRANDILTDKKQRTIYRKIGHDEYMKHTNNGQEPSLSLDILNDVTEEGAVQREANSSSRYQRESNVSEGKTAKGYQKLLDDEFDGGPEHRVSKLFEIAFTTRVLLLATFSVAIFYLLSTTSESAISLYSYPHDIIIPAFGLLMMVIVVSMTGILASVVLAQTHSRIREQRAQYKKEKRRKEVQNRVSGLSPDEQVDVNISPPPKWDDTTYISPSKGSLGLLVAVILIIGANQVPGSLFFDSINSLLDPSSNFKPWMDGWSTEGTEVMLILNLIYIGIFAGFCFMSVLYICISTSKKYWRLYYYSPKSSIHPLFVDLITFTILLFALLPLFLHDSLSIPQQGTFPDWVLQYLMSTPNPHGFDLVIYPLLLFIAYPLVLYSLNRIFQKIPGKKKISPSF